MPKSFNPSTDVPDLTGKVAVVTGGNAGIGLSTVKFLALRGAKVYLAARSETKAKAAIDRLLKDFQDKKEGHIIWLPLDLADLKSVSRAVEELKGKETMVDILINNAGMVTGSTEKVMDGWEIHMAVCHVGHFVFTNGLLPLLKAAAAQEGSDVRVVTLSSNANGMIPPDYDFKYSSPSCLADPVSHYPWQWQYLLKPFFADVDMIRYGLAKVANILFAQELQRILDEEGSPIISVSIHPGGVATDAAMTIGKSLFKTVARYAFLSVDQGSYTSLFAATSKEIRKDPKRYKGKYLVPYGDLKTPHKVTKDQKQVRALWDTTTTEANRYLTTIDLPQLQQW